MMKKFFMGIFVAVASMAMFASCDKGPSAKDLTVKITGVSVEVSALNFTVEATNATSLYYEVEADGVIIASETVAMDASSQSKSLSTPIENNKAKFLIRATVTGATAEETAYVEYAVDPAVDALQYFFKKVNVLQFTATWCGYCPQMSTSLNKMNEKFPGRISVIAVHGSDAIAAKSSNMLMSKFNIKGFPTAIMDYNKKAKSSQSYSVVLKTVKNEVNNFPATTDIKLSAVLNGESIDVTANIKNIVAAAEYKYVCAVIESDIKVSGGTSPTGKYNNVLRTFYTPEFGQAVVDANGAEFTTLPTEGETTVTLNGKFDKKWKAENCSVVFLTFKYNAEADNWFVDNSNVVELGGTAEYLGIEEGME